MSLWEKIADYLSKKGFQRMLLNTLMEFIDAPNDPIELERVMANLVRVVAILQKTAGLYPPHLSAVYNPDWGALCKAILQYPRLEPESKPFRRKRKIPLWGNYQKHQVYVALWTRPEGLANQERYYSILAHLCLAISALRADVAAKWRRGRDSRDENNQFHSCIQSALLAIRKLAYPSNRSILESFPDVRCSSLQELLKVLENSNELCAPMVVLFRYLLLLKKTVDRQENEDQREPKLRIPARLTELGDNYDQDQIQVSSVDLLQLPAIGEGEAHKALEAGCSVDEYLSGTEIALSNRSPVRSNISSPMQKAVFTRQIKVHLSMANQRFPGRWESLSLHEVSAFLSAVSSLIRAKGESPYLPPDTDEPMELAAVLTTMFWLGQRLDDALDMHCYYWGAKKNDRKPGFVLDDRSDGYWRMAPAVPKRVLLPDEIQKRQAHKIVDIFPTATGIGVERIVSEYVRKSHRRRSKYLFPRPLKHYARMVDAFIAILNKQYSLRLSSNRISDYMFEQISSWEGSDIAVAMHLTGREHFLGRNPAYYTALPVATLQAIYSNVCSDIRARHLTECQREVKPQIGVQKLVPTCDGYVGSPFRPTLGTVTKLVSHLKEKLDKAADEGEMTVLKLLRLHNSMSRYSILMLGYGTGFRAVRDPLLCSVAIDWHTGFAIARDKDNEDRYNSRLIWIPPVCLEQLKLYREHMQDVLYRFNILIPNLYDRLGRRRSTSGLNSFFVKSDTKEGYDAMIIGPKLLQSGLTGVYALPINANRHFVRSSLLERGCPIEVINAFMGHWERGEEPWGRHSGLSPVVFRDVLARYLVPLLEEAGWTPTAGFRRGK